MRIAILASKTPTLESGANSRNYYLAKGLSKKNFVKLYVLPKIPKEYSFFKKILILLRGQIPYIESLREVSFPKKVIEELQSYDVIQIEEMFMFHFFEKYITNIKAKIILDTHNVDYERFLSEIKSKWFLEKLIGRVLAEKIKRLEIRAIKQSNHILTCSEREKEYFGKFISKDMITVIPNGATVYKDNVPRRKVDNTNILFMGLLSYQPNEEGLKYYLNNIHNKVLTRVPNAKLVILGKEAPKWLTQKAKKDSTIELLGFVKNVRRYVETAKVCICPILSGSGTRLKILEYMSFSKPVVSTTLGAEGTNIKNGFNILLADTPNDFTESIVSVISNKNLAENLGLHARKLIKTNYDWDIITDKLSKLYLEIKFI